MMRAIKKKEKAFMSNGKEPLDEFQESPKEPSGKESSLEASHEEEFVAEPREAEKAVKLQKAEATLREALDKYSETRVDLGKETYPCGTIPAIVSILARWCGLSLEEVLQLMNCIDQESLDWTGFHVEELLTLGDIESITKEDKSRGGEEPLNEIDKIHESLEELSGKESSLKANYREEFVAGLREAEKAVELQKAEAALHEAFRKYALTRADLGAPCLRGTIPAIVSILARWRGLSLRSLLEQMKDLNTGNMSWVGFYLEDLAALSDIQRIIDEGDNK